MRISISDVEYVAALSRLELTGEEKVRLQKNLDDILLHVEALIAADTEGVPPTSHILPLKNVFREDTVRPSLDIESIVANAPEKMDGCFIVPKTVE